MNLKHLLLAIFSLITTSSYSQTHEKTVMTTPNAITEFSLKTDKIEELKDFDWSTLDELFKTNEDDQIIKMAFEYNNVSKKKNSKQNIKNSKF